MKNGKVLVNENKNTTQTLPTGQKLRYKIIYFNPNTMPRRDESSEMSRDETKTLLNIF